MHLVAIALISMLAGACTYWLCVDIAAERTERRRHALLLQLVEDYVAEVNDNDRKVPESLTIGRPIPILALDISNRGTDFSSPPLTAALRSAVDVHGAAIIEGFTVEAVGEATAIGHLITSFDDLRHPSERRQILRVAGEIVFKKEDGDWRISGTVL